MQEARIRDPRARKIEPAEHCQPLEVLKAIIRDSRSPHVQGPELREPLELRETGVCDAGAEEVHGMEPGEDLEVAQVRVADDGAVEVDRNYQPACEPLRAPVGVVLDLASEPMECGYRPLLFRVWDHGFARRLGPPQC